MKKSFFSLILILQVIICFGQVPKFEGKILYKNKFSLPNGQDITNVLSAQLGAEQDYSINAKNYKSILNGAAIKMQLYKSDENKYYYVMGNDSVQVMDASEPTDSIIKIEVLNETKQILGRTCKGLIMIGNNSKTTYYFDETLKVDPKVYAMHKFGNWSDYMAAANGALPLQFIVEDGEFNWEATAIKIEAKKLPDSEFLLTK